MAGGPSNAGKRGNAMAMVKGSRVAEPIRGAQAGAANMNGPRQRSGDISMAEARRRAASAPIVQQLGQHSDAKIATAAYQAARLKQRALPEKERSSMDAEVQRTMMHAFVAKSREAQGGATFERSNAMRASGAAKKEKKAPSVLEMARQDVKENARHEKRVKAGQNRAMKAFKQFKKRGQELREAAKAA